MTVRAAVMLGSAQLRSTIHKQDKNSQEEFLGIFIPYGTWSGGDNLSKKKNTYMLEYKAYIEMAGTAERTALIVLS
jgi:hypothetical protein